MKYEVVCHNRSCPSYVKYAAMGDDELIFNHWMLSSSNDRCPACGCPGAEVKREVPDEHQFALGEVGVTAAAAKIVDETHLKAILKQHVAGDWGAVDPADKKTNDLGVGSDHRPTDRTRLMSVYHIDKQVIWVFTEAGHHVTTVMLPEDY